MRPGFLIAGGGVSAKFVRHVLIAHDVARLRTCPEKIDVGEDADPDDVESMPEQAETHPAPQDVGPEALGPELRHHGAKPEQTDRDVQAVATDQREEGGQKGATLRASAFSQHLDELVSFQKKEADAEQA